MQQATNDGSGRTTTNRGGRPSKLNNKFLEAFQNLVFKKNRKGEIVVKAYILLEDHELVEFINGTMENPADRVHWKTYHAWKVDARRFGEGYDPDEPDNTLGDDVTFAKFYGLYRMALLWYKMKLLEEIAENVDPSWRGKSWLLERRFRDWHLSDDMKDEENQKIIKRFIFKTKAPLWQVKAK